MNIQLGQLKIVALFFITLLLSGWIYSELNNDPFESPIPPNRIVWVGNKSFLYESRWISVQMKGYDKYGYWWYIGGRDNEDYNLFCNYILSLDSTATCFRSLSDINVSPPFPQIFLPLVSIDK